MSLNKVQWAVRSCAERVSSFFNYLSSRNGPTGAANWQRKHTGLIQRLSVGAVLLILFKYVRLILFWHAEESIKTVLERNYILKSGVHGTQWHSVFCKKKKKKKKKSVELTPVMLFVQVSVHTKCVNTMRPKQNVRHSDNDILNALKESLAFDSPKYP